MASAVESRPPLTSLIRWYYIQILQLDGRAVQLLGESATCQRLPLPADVTQNLAVGEALFRTIQPAPVYISGSTTWSRKLMRMRSRAALTFSCIGHLEERLLDNLPGIRTIARRLCSKLYD